MTTNDTIFECFREAYTHDGGTPKTPDKAKVFAINTALQALLANLPTVTPDEIRAWIMGKYGFNASTICPERINEHCLYEAGMTGTPKKSFQQPKENASLRVVEKGVYALTYGSTSYSFETRSHGNK